MEESYILIDRFHDVAQSFLRLLSRLLQHFGRVLPI